MAAHRLLAKNGSKLRWKIRSHFRGQPGVRAGTDNPWVNVALSMPDELTVFENPAHAVEGNTVNSPLGLRNIRLELI